MLVDASGITIADTGNHRIRSLSPGAAIADPIVLGSRLTILNAASRLPGPLAAGQLVVVSPASDVTEVLFNGISAPVISTKGSEVTVVVPDELAELDAVDVSASSLHAVAKVAVAAPGVFLPFLNEDGTANGPDNPAARGGVITAAITGEGRSGAPIAARVGSGYAEILDKRPAPDRPGGTLVDIRLPSGYFPAGSFSLIVETAGFASQPGIAVSIR